MKKPLRPCLHPGCTALTSGTYCEAHRPKRQRYASASWHRWYNLPIWRRMRSAQLTLEPWCRECARHDRTTRATEVDHVIPHRGDWALFTEADNLQSLCHTCHSRKTMAENQQIFGGKSGGGNR